MLPKYLQTIPKIVEKTMENLLVVVLAASVVLVVNITHTPRIVPEYCQNNPKIVPEYSQNNPRILPQ